MKNILESYTIHVIHIDILYKLGNQKKNLFPRFEKIILHGSTQRLLGEKRQLLRSALEWELLSFQRPIGTRTKQNIASWNLREKTPIGVQTTLRGKKMYEFLSRCLFLYFPRMSNFHPANGTYKKGVWTCIFEDIRSFIEVEYFFQHFETYPAIQCLIFFKKQTAQTDWDMLYLSAFSIPLASR